MQILSGGIALIYRKSRLTRRCSRRFGLSRSVRCTARAIPPRG